MAAKKTGAKGKKKPVKPAKRKVAVKATKVAKRASERTTPASRPVKRPVKRETARPPEPGKGATPSAPVPVTVATLRVVELEPLRAEASAAFSRGETVLLETGINEEGGRVETLLFAPSGKAAQSSGTFVHRGDWSGERLVTDKGHLLDLGGNCFCRDCEAAKGYTLDDDE